MIDIQSIIVYLGLAAICFFVARLAEATNNRKIIWLIVVALSLIAGLRSLSVGIDSISYNRIFVLILTDNHHLIYSVEKGFVLFCELLLKIWSNTNFVFFVLAVLSHSLIIFTLWKKREYISFSLGVLSYYIMFFAFSLNGMRQFLAVALVIYGTNFLKDGKYIRFILVVLVAAIFHNTALVGFIYIFFDFLFIKSYPRKRKILLISLGGVGAVLSLILIVYLFNQYNGYFDRQGTFGLMMLVKLFLMILSIVLIGIPVDKEERRTVTMITAYYSVGVVLNSLSYVFLYMGRIGLYFYVFEPFFVGYVFKVKSRNVWITILKLIYVILIAYFCFDLLVSNRQGELPYRFFWQMQGRY